MSEENPFITNLSPKQLHRKYESMPQKSRIKCLIRILITIGCISGLLYYSIQLLYQYSKGQTVVNIKIETSFNNHFVPSITICYPQLLSMERIAQKYDELKPTFEKYQEHVENSTEGGYDNEKFTKIIHNLYWSNMTKTVESYKLTANELFNLSIPYELDYDPFPHYPININVKGHHIFRNGSSLESSAIDYKPTETVVFKQNRKMEKCFTFFSHINKTWRNYYMVIKEINIQIYHNNNHFPRSNYIDKNMKFSMHSPNTLPQTLGVNNFIELTANHFIEMTYNRWKTKLLGPEYNTNCHDYDMDDNIYYRFRSDCINHCIQRQLNQCSKDRQIQRNASYLKCLFPTDALWRRPAFTLYNYLKLCRFWDNLVNYDCLYLHMGQIEVKCHEECGPECVNRYYSYSIQKSSKLFSGFIQIKIVHDHFPDQTTLHMPEMTFVSFASNFGGLLGMWLGLSALAILKFILKLI